MATLSANNATYTKCSHTVKLNATNYDAYVENMARIAATSDMCNWMFCPTLVHDAMVALCRTEGSTFNLGEEDTKVYLNHADRKRVRNLLLEGTVNKIDGLLDYYAKLLHQC